MAGVRAPGRAPGAGRAARRYDQDKLLTVAVGVFIERGYDGTSMEDLARAAGIGKSSLYHHIQSKEQLLRLAVDRALGALFALTDESLEKQFVAEAGLDEGPAGGRTGHSGRGGTQPRAVDRLEKVLGRMVEVLVAELPYVTLLLRVRGNTGTERYALERRRRFDRWLRALFAEAAAAGDVRADLDLAVVERLTTGMVNSLTEWYRPGRSSVEELKNTVVALAMSGLRPAR